MFCAGTWSDTPGPLRMSRDAAAIACLCRAARAAVRASSWPAVVRIRRDGMVLEPASGAFNETEAPGQSVQAAVDRCRPGGSILLLPGVHEGPMVLGETETHLFGRNAARLWMRRGALITSTAPVATVDRLILWPMLEWKSSYGVHITSGRLRLQACDVDCLWSACIVIEGAATNPLVIGCRCGAGYARSNIVSAASF